MKKVVLILLISMLIISGCSNEKKEYSINFDTYKIFQPYKASISGNYINSMITNKYDVNNIQSRLMDLSTRYYKTSNNYYQAGQYVTKDNIKEILNLVNPTNQINVDGIEIQPNYISYLHEQNYLDADGNLAGISIGLALNKYQTYQNSYGTTLYKEVSEEFIIDYAKNEISTILEYLRKIDGINDTRIMLGLYFLESPNSILPGEYKYFGITSDNNINFQELDYSHYYLDSNTLMEKNIEIYNNFKAFQQQIKLDNIYISGYGFFDSNNLVDADITINTNYLNKDELIFLQQVVSKSLLENFRSNAVINVYIKTNKEIIGIVIKNEDSKTVNYLFD